MFGEVFETNSVVRNNVEKLSVTRMKSSSNYWLVVYRKDNNEIIYNQQVSASSYANVPINRDVDYKWIAYSYDDNSNLSSPYDINNPSPFKLEIATTINKPFMVDMGEVKVIDDNSTSLQEQSINILFKHKTVRSRIKLDVSEIQQNPYLINTASGNSNIEVSIPTGVVYNGTFDFLTGSQGDYLPNMNTAIIPLSAIDFPDIQEAGTGFLDADSVEAKKKIN